MSSVNLKHFVDINIKQSVPTAISGTRDTIVLFTSETTDGESHVISSLSEAQTIYSGKTNTLAYLQMYFRNGGCKVKVIEDVSIQDIEDALQNLSDEDICIAYAASASERENAYATLKAIAIAREINPDVYGINEKLILACTANTPEEISVKNFAVKYSSIPGAEMTIGAYLSQIDVYGIDTVKDYMYTSEILNEDDKITFGAEELTDNEYEQIVDNNLNVDIYLANACRNCGGNCKDGSDIVNSFVKIILHQTLTSRLIALLAQKIKSTDGISKIYTVIVNELERYLSCGYLTTDKIWTNETLKLRYNGKDYTIIEKGSALTSGYVVKVLPMSSLTEIDKQSRKAPPIYIILADQYSIRQITINGEVI